MVTATELTAIEALYQRPGLRASAPEINRLLATVRALLYENALLRQERGDARADAQHLCHERRILARAVMAENRYQIACDTRDQGAIEAAWRDFECIIALAAPLARTIMDTPESGNLIWSEAEPGGEDADNND